MISLNAANARVRRQKISEFAGSRFVGGIDVPQKFALPSEFCEEQFLFGICSDNEIWTVVSVNHLISSVGGQVSSFQLDTETRSIFEYFGFNGIEFSDFMRFPDGRNAWFCTPDLCALILNILLMLEAVPCGTRLSE